MKGLFLKTFVWFWLTTIITISATYFISSRLTDNNRHTHDIDEIVAHYFEEFEQELNEQGIGEFARELKHQRLPRGIGILLVDDHNNVIAVKRVPKPILQHYLDTGNWPEPRGVKLNIKAKAFEIDARQLTLFILWLPKKVHADNFNHRPWFKPFQRTPGWAAFRLLLALLVSGLICYFLARYISKPIVKLRAAVNQVEQGNYDHKVAAEFKNRSDEIADLASDFDRMSDEIKNQFQQREELLRDISHELRSPLARMRVASELIKEKIDASNSSEIDRIECEISRLDDLIGEIIDFSKLTNQSSQVNKQQINLVELIQQIIADVNFEGESTHKQATFNTSYTRVDIYANKTLIMRAIENVLRNALKYSANDTDVTCSLALENHQAIIAVADKGPGVPEHELEQIFEPFYRTSKSRDRKSGGTGLGLAISKQAIEVHQGEIKANNGEEHGLVVTIRLPLSTQTIQ